MEKEILEILKNMQSDIKNIKSDITSMKSDITSMKSDITSMKSDIADLKVKQEETYLIAKALEHSAQVNRAEHDKMAHDIAEIKGEVASIRKDLVLVESVTSKNWNEITQLKLVK